MSDPHPNAADARAGEPAQLAPSAELERYARPGELDRLCQAVRDRNREMEARQHALVHVETTTSQEFDRKGKETARERVVERVWFVNQVEHRLLLKKEIGGKDVTPPNVQAEQRPKADMSFPLAASEPPNSYHYTLVGMETVNGRAAIKLNFEPLPPADKKFRGHVWIDAANHEPVRFFGAWAKLPPLVNEMTMLLDWGQAENGDTQLRSSLVNGAGGLAFFQKRYRIETRLVDYRDPGSNPTAQR